MSLRRLRVSRTKIKIMVGVRVHERMPVDNQFFTTLSFSEKVIATTNMRTKRIVLREIFIKKGNYGEIRSNNKR